MKNAALIGAIVCVVGQIATVVVMMKTADTAAASTKPGFGALLAAATFMVVFFFNHAMLKKGIEPEFKENDIKRKAQAVNHAETEFIVCGSVPLVKNCFDAFRRFCA